MSKNTGFHIIIFFVVFLSVGLALQVRYWKSEVETLAGLEPTVITVTDTIVELKPDTVFFKEKITDTFYVLNIIRDSITDTLYAQVELPISTYIFDTTINNDTSNVVFHIIASGYRVSLDTLSYKIHHSLLSSYETLTPDEKWYDRLGVGVGVMAGTGGIGVGVGIMYKLF